MWFEKKNPVTEKAQRHFEVSFKKNFDKEFGNRTEIVPISVSLHLSIDNRDFIKFVEIAKNFSDEHNSDMKISTDGTDTSIEIPKNKLYEFVRELERNKGFELDEKEIEQVKQLMEN